MEQEALLYRRRTARCDVSVEILPTDARQRRNKSYNKSRTDRSMKLDGYSRPTCKTRSTVVGVIHKLDRRRVLSTAPSTCRGDIFQVQSLRQRSRGKYPNFPIRLQRSLEKVNGSTHAKKTSSISLVVSIQYQLATNRQADGRTDTHTTTAYTALAYRRAVKMHCVSNKLLKSSDVRRTAVAHGAFNRICQVVSE